MVYPNILIGIPSPRDIPLFRQYTAKLKPDRLWVKYYEQIDAYIFMTDYFLQHPEYDYLCILPDDLLVTQKDIDILVEDIHDYKCPVVCGYCNLNARRDDLTNICIHTIVTPLTSNQKRGWLLASAPVLKSKMPFRVKFAGFPLMMIRNDVVEKIPFRPADDTRGGSGLDDTFCYDCNEHGVPIIVDPRVKLEHLKHALDSRFGPDDMQIFVGIKKPHYYLDTVKSNP